MYLKILSNEKLLKKKEISRKYKSISNSFKQQNLNISSLGPDYIIELQNKIGNKQTAILLRELGNLQINTKGLWESYYGDNENLEMSREVSNFKKASKNNSLDSEDAVKSGRFSVNHNNENKPSVNSHGLTNSLRGLIQMVNFFKGYDSRQDDKKEEIKLQDKMLSRFENKKVKEAKMVMDMIKQLPHFNGDEKAISQYMKVENFLISSGLRLEDFFSNNGDVLKQKEVILRAINNK